VDGAGSAYVTGRTRASDFPTTAGAFDTSHNGNYDAFVVKLNASGTGLAYATFLGWSDYDGGDAIAVDGAGSAYVMGSTYSSLPTNDFPTTAGAFDTSFNGYYDTFVVKLNASGTGLAYATFLGGSSNDWSSAIAVDGAGSAYVMGYTQSSDFPTTPGAFDTNFSGGDRDAFVVKLNASGTGLAYATFLGGGYNGADGGIAVDETGSAYVIGSTESSDFPTTPGAFDTSHNGNSDAFVVKLNAGGTALAYATFLGGSWADTGYAIAVDGAGSAHVTGRTRASDFPTTPGAFDTSHNGWNDVFVVKVKADGTGLDYATFLGGSDYDYGHAIAVDGADNAYVTGFAESSDFPTMPGAFDTTHNGFYDTFVAKLDLRDAGEPTYAISGYVQDRNSNPVTGVTVDAGSSSTATTDASGAYTLTLNAGVYTLTPSKSGYSFSPARRIVELSQDVTDPNFVGVADGGIVTSFLDLPFDYGGSMAVFEMAMRNWSNGNGWIQSWFDHKYPNYNKNDGTGIWTYRQAYTSNPRWVGTLLCYGAYCYDGHNGIDFAGTSTEIYPAAGGVVVFKKTGCVKGIDCGDPYGNNVVVDHQNGYFTRYGHLVSVSVSQGSSVTPNDVLGIMGSTGNSRGAHLHFSVHRDDGNYQWDGEDVDRVVDPFGWAKDEISDPWVVDHQGPVSHPLWVPQTGDEKTFTGDQGAILSDATNTIQTAVPPGAFSGQVTLELSPGPVAQPSAQLRSVGKSFRLRFLELLSPGGGGMQGQNVGLQATSSFTPTQPITLTATYTETAVRHLDVSQLSLYRWNEGSETWETLATAVNPTQRQVTGQTTELGEFELQAPLLCPSDSTEPDDSYNAAPVVATDGTVVSRLFDITDDEDWFRFTAEAGKTYEMATSNLATGIDTVLTASYLEWQSPLSGIYFLRVLPVEGSPTGCSAIYNLDIAEKTQAGGIYLPLILKNYQQTKTSLFYNANGGPPATINDNTRRRSLSPVGPMSPFCTSEWAWPLWHLRRPS
jgi:murein DD-endopeptidase MepM/ murein hydrolase activator NlpD